MALEQHVGQLRTAHQQIGQVGVGPVVDQRGAVQPRRVQAGRQHHARRAPPNPIPTAHRRGCRRRRRRGPRPSPWRPPTRSARAGCRAGRAATTAPRGGRLALAVIRIGPSVRGGGAVTVSVRYTSPRAGSATAASVMPRRPVGEECRRPGDSSAATARCAPPSPSRPGDGELAGAVHRVDDPHPVGVHPGQVVDGFLGEHRVVGPVDAAGRGSACWPACHRRRRGRRGRRSRSPRAPPAAVHRRLRPPRRPAPHRSGSSGQYHQPLGCRHHRIAALRCCDDEHSRSAVVRFAHFGAVEGEDSVGEPRVHPKRRRVRIGIAGYDVVRGQ